MKQLLALCLCLMLACAAPFAAAEEAAAQDGYIGMMEVINCNEWVSIRERPSESAPRLTQVPLGAVVQDARPFNPKWIHASYNGFEGYILAEYLTPRKAEAAAPAEAAPIPEGAVRIAVVTAKDGAALYTDTTGATPTREHLPCGVVARNCVQQANGVMYLEYNGRCLYADGSSLTPYDQLSSLERLPAPLLIATDLAYDNSNDAAPPVSVAWEDEKLEISTTDYATDFRLWTLVMTDKGSEGYFVFEAREQLLLERLCPSETLRTAVELTGSTPGLAVSYLDGEQVSRLFLVELSGVDGSLSMTEI